MDYINGSWWTKDTTEEPVGVMSPDEAASKAFEIVGAHIEAIPAPRPNNIACPRCGRAIEAKRAAFLQEHKMPCVCKACAMEMIRTPIGVQQGGEMVMSYNGQGQRYILGYLKGRRAIQG